MLPPVIVKLTEVKQSKKEWYFEVKIILNQHDFICRFHSDIWNKYPKNIFIISFSKSDVES